MKPSPVNLLALGLSLSLSLGAPGKCSPVNSTADSKDTQLQKLVNEARKNLKQLETDRNSPRASSSDLSTKCHKLINKAQELSASMNPSSDKNKQLADVLMLKANLLELTGNIDSEPLETALKIREKAFGPNNPKVGETLNKLAYVVLRKGEISNAADLLNRSIQIMEFNKGTGASELADALDKCMRRGFQRAIEARRITRKATRSIAKYAGKESAAMATCLHALSLSGSEQGFVWGAEKLPPSEEETALIQAIKLQEKGGKESLKIAEFLETLAQMQDRKGKTDEAVKTYKRVVELREKLAGENFSLLPSTYNKYKDYLLQNKDTVQAEATMKKLFAFYEKYPGEEEEYLKSGLVSMGSFYKRIGKPKEAIACYERAFKIQNKHGDTNTDVLDELSKLYFQLGDYSNSERTLKIAFSTLAKNYKSTRPEDDYAIRDKLLNLAITQTKLSKFDEAGKNFQRVKDSFERISNLNNFLYLGEKLPKNFMIPYVEYLQKTGKTSEAQAMKTRLDAFLKKELAVCPGCGRG
ncbi:MAG: tetratricopeptide repeat protein [Candidatus Melainabacteria bacterium]|nr:MAG: tetratricopeptide repeat protein [Candidatus Melainabacteria bacterium]